MDRATFQALQTIAGFIDDLRADIDPDLDEALERVEDWMAGIEKEIEG